MSNWLANTSGHSANQWYYTQTSTIKIFKIFPVVCLSEKDYLKV
jgi:hypothetical protein